MWFFYLIEQSKMIHVVAPDKRVIDKQQLALHKSRQAQCAFAQADYTVHVYSQATQASIQTSVLQNDS